MVAPDQGAAKLIQQLIGCDDTKPLPMDSGIEIKKRGRAKTVFRSGLEGRDHQNRRRHLSALEGQSRRNTLVCY